MTALAAWEHWVLAECIRVSTTSILGTERDNISDRDFGGLASLLWATLNGRVGAVKILQV